MATIPNIETTINRLTGTSRDAAALILNIFTSYGLAALAPRITDFVRQGYSPDTVSVLLQETPEYKTRFSANTTRLSKNLPLLSPAEYIATERAYAQTLQKYGLPVGFYDQPADFNSFISKDISPAEIDQRAKAASDFITRKDAEQLAFFRQHYTTGDMIAFALDSTRAAPLVGKAFESAAIGGNAANNGIAVSALQAEELYGAGIDQGQAAQGFALVGQDAATAAKLSSIQGSQLTNADLIAATFGVGNAADAALKKNKMASRERAAFGGAGGLSSTALTK